MTTTMTASSAKEELRPLTACEIDCVAGGASGIRHEAEQFSEKLIKHVLSQVKSGFAKVTHAH